MSTYKVMTGLVIESLERRNNSVNGNPRWRVTFTSGLVADTMSDAMVSYELNNPEFRDTPLEVSFTRAGNIAYAKPESRNR